MKGRFCRPLSTLLPRPTCRANPYRITPQKAAVGKKRHVVDITQYHTNGA